jgi:hypothetical protein
MLRNLWKLMSLTACSVHGSVHVYREVELLACFVAENCPVSCDHVRCVPQQTYCVCFSIATMLLLRSEC